MSLLPLTLACAAYDRTLPLYDGRVLPEGIDLNVLLLRYEDTFWRMLRHQEFDVSEMSLSSYLISKEKGPDFVALPIFLTGYKDWWYKVNGSSWIGVTLFAMVMIWFYLLSKKNEEDSQLTG